MSPSGDGHTDGHTGHPDTQGGVLNTAAGQHTGSVRTLVELPHVQELVRVNAGDWAAGDVAHVVHSCALAPVLSNAKLANVPLAKETHAQEFMYLKFK